MKKFKHKITGFIATETNSGKNYRVSENHNYTIPTWIIENSNDWEQVFDIDNNFQYPKGTIIKDNMSLNDNSFYVKTDKENKWKYFDSSSEIEYTIYNSEIGNLNRYSIFCEKKSEYDLSYNDLCNGQFYATEYPGQGKYIFKHGYNLWYSESFMMLRTSDSNFNPKNGFNFFRKATKKEIEFLTHPCFSKDWEILSVIKTKGSKDFIPIVNGVGKHCSLYGGIITSSLKELIIDKNFLIYQVKRNSDGEVFTIGDRIRGYKNTEIKEIKLKSGEIEILTEESVYGSVVYRVPFQLDNCIKLKNPLFKTVDNVDIFEGDFFYEVNVIHGIKKWHTEYPVYLNKDILKNLFYKKENAEEYYLLNKPCLSIKDVQKVYTSANGSFKKNGNGYNYLDKLKNIVKNK